VSQSGARINADFSGRVVLDTHAMPWVASPLPGVDRRMLDRVGDEVARATSIVRYAAQSRFSEHVHDLGEEFIVLQGVFSDEHGDYPAGTYVRNPPSTRHAPHSDEGCTIFVKLRQFAREDMQPVRINLYDAQFDEELAPGVHMVHLHRYRDEYVRALRFAPGSRLPAQGWSVAGGEELLVIDGAVSDHRGQYGAGSWQRNPPGESCERSSAGGALVFAKTGHLSALIPAR
jgi:anti-sigma factor ChrR (cupin superfamily)